jgi:hypothetical protein
MAKLPLQPSLPLVVGLAALCLLGGASLAAAQNWSNYGGGPERNGLSGEVGPKSADLLWSNTNDPTLISWHPFVWVDPVTGQGIVVNVREAGFPSGSAANDSLVAYDLDTGVELWRRTVPFVSSSVDWIAWIAGISPNGILWASRSDNSKQRPLQRYDVRTGTLLGATSLSTFAWAHDGAVFGPDGDIVVGDRERLVRLDEATGAVVWNITRNCSVSGHCGPALAGDALYIDQVGPGGQVITRVDYNTGQKLYSSPVMPGFTAQNAPFAAPGGGRVYFARTQNNPAVDLLFAFDDNGSALTQAWSRPLRWTTSHEHGIGLDGSLYTFLPGGELARLAPADGAVLNVTAPLLVAGESYSPKTAVDQNGTVYVSNGWAGTPATNGRLWAFDRELNPLFTLNLDRPNSGGPALAQDGTLVLSERPALRAWRSLATVAAFFFENGTNQNPADYQTFDAPSLGNTWSSSIALTPTSVLSLLAIAPGPAVALPYICPSACELLVQPAGVFLYLYDFATGSHNLSIPATPSLSGLELISQGGRIDWPAAGVPSLQLLNAYRLRLGV